MPKLISRHGSMLPDGGFQMSPRPGRPPLAPDTAAGGPGDASAGTKRASLSGLAGLGTPLLAAYETPFAHAARLSRENHQDSFDPRRFGSMMGGGATVPARLAHQATENFPSIAEALLGGIDRNLGFLSGRFEGMFNCFKLDKQGDLTQTTMSSKELIRDAKLVPRDLIFLQLSCFLMPAESQPGVPDSLAFSRNVSNTTSGTGGPQEELGPRTRRRSRDTNKNSSRPTSLAGGFSALGASSTGSTPHPNVFVSQANDFEPAPCIRPRKRSIIIVLGAFRGIIMEDHAYFFCKYGSEGYRYDAIHRISRAIDMLRKAGADQHEDNTGGMPFWLRVLEECLKDVCNGWQRQLALISHVVESKLALFEGSGEIDRILALFGPLSDGINGFDSQVDIMIDMLTDNDLEEDLSEFDPELQRANSDSPMQRDGRTSPYNPRFSREDINDLVEVVVETYHNQFLSIQHGSQRLQSRIATAQSVADLSLDVRRNQLARVQNDLETAEELLALMKLLVMLDVFAHY